MWEYEDEKCNILYIKEYEETLTEDILNDIYDIVREHTTQLDLLFLPLDSTARHTKTTKTEKSIWLEWVLSPPESELYYKLNNTEVNIRRCLHVINKCRLKITDSKSKELAEERIKNATFNIGEKELIEHDRHSHTAHSIFYGILGFLEEEILTETIPEKPKPQSDMLPGHEGLTSTESALKLIFEEKNKKRR